MHGGGSFWVEPGCLPGLGPQETEDYIRREVSGYRDQGMAWVADVFEAHLRDQIRRPRPGPGPGQVEEWQRRHGVELPATLREALREQDGGIVLGTRLVIARLEAMRPLGRAEWAHLWEFDENRAFGDPAGLIEIGADGALGGIMVLDGNAGPDPRILWLWRDLGDELRAEGGLTFDETVALFRKNSTDG